MKRSHCHASQHVRGLLCQHCNVMLGMARESSDILRSAADYLERKLPISPGSKE